MDSSYDQLVQTGNYRPTLEEARAAMHAEGTLRIDLTPLRLQGDKKEWRYVEISTTAYDSLNDQERALAERFYGEGAAFVTAMQTLQQAGIENTKVYVLNPEYVKTQASEGPVARAAWRSGFDVGANSNAGGRGVNDHVGLLGVRRRVAAGAPKIGLVP